MNPPQLTHACSQLEKLAAILGSDAELPGILDALDQLLPVFSLIKETLAHPPSSELDAADLPVVRAALTDLQRALVHVEQRLQREHHSILLQLHELSAQQEWAQLSRQSG